MDKLTFSKDSWHYRFINATTSAFKSWNDAPSDICTYTRAFIAGVLKCLLLGTVALVGATLFACAVTWWASLVFKFSLWSWALQFAHIGTLILGALTLLLAIFAFVAGVEWIRGKLRERRRNQPARAPSAAAEMYSSWKNKTCKQIEFT